jgi:DNA-binding SARP family transcriptional activator
VSAEFHILGPLEAAVDGRQLPLGGVKQRALLALLLLHANEVVSRDRLIDELWGETPPATVAAGLHVYVSRLRKVLAPIGDGVALERDGYGYVLKIEPEQLDLWRFERFARSGREALGAGDPERAASELRAALALWHGPALADLAYEPFAAARVGRLEELRIAATEDRIDADLALGRHRELVVELEELVTEHPHRERLHAQLMLALYRSGRQADALGAYRAASRALGDDLGLEPGPALRRLERSILAQDPALELAPAPTPVVAGTSPAERRRGRRVALALAGAAVVAAIPIVFLVATHGGGSHREVVVAPHSVVVLDPKTNEVVGDVRGTGDVLDLAAGGGAVWGANRDDNTVVRIDERTRRPRVVGVGISPERLTFGAGGAWALDPFGERVVRVRPDGLVERPIRLSWGGIGPPTTVAAGEGAVWIAYRDVPELARLDPRTGHLRTGLGGGDQGHFFRGEGQASLVVGGNAVWFSNRTDEFTGEGSSGRVTKLAPDGSLLAEVFVGGVVESLAAGSAAVWAADDGGVWRIDPRRNAPVVHISFIDRPVGIAARADAVWVVTRGGTVRRIDPRTNTVVAVVRLPYTPWDVEATPDAVWVSVGTRS